MTREGFAKSSSVGWVGLGWEGTNPLPPTRGMGAFRRLPEELRRLASEAYVLWRDLAKARANPYGDHSACLLAGRMAVDASNWEDGLVVLDAIRRRMDEKSSPRRIPEWARELGATKREQARLEQYKAEGRDANGRRIAGADDGIDPEVRRVMRSLSAARARGDAVNIESFTCVSCRQFTETKCAGCSRPLHTRACPARHECEA